MGLVKLDIGSKIIFDDKEYMIKSFPSLDEVLAKLTTTPYNEKILKVSEIIKESRNANESTKSLVEVNDEKFQQALERYLIIEPLLNIPNRKAEDVEKIAKQSNKGTATIYRWLSTFEQYNTVSSLATNRENCGQKGKSRLNESVNAIINAVIDEFYLNKQQYPLSIIYMKIAEKCKNIGADCPNINTIRNRINNIQPKLVAKHRKGMPIRETRGMPSNFPEVKMPLDVIQIDHTKMDVIIVDEKTRESIGRPYITVAIDVFSRMIYGFYITLEAPSFFSVGQCLLNAILPKDDTLKQYDIKGEWPVYGLPRVIHMDNAKEFRSISLHNFCQEFRISDVYRPVARPEFGGHVERVIKTCMQNVHQLPGTTRSSIAERGTYKSEDYAAMTIDELEKWYLDFVVNIYHKTVHGSIGMTPEEKLYQGIFGIGEGTIPFLPTVPSNTLKLRMALLPAIERTVQKNGITIDYITYFSETLRKWIIPSQYKKINPNINNKLLCRRDPRDVSKIYVYDEDIKDYIIVPYADIRRPKMDLTELRKSIAEARKAVSGRELEPYDIFEAYDRLQQYVKNAKFEKKSVRRQKSSKLHMNKNLKMEKELLDNSQMEAVKSSNKTIEDDDGYEYYPIG